MPEKRCRKPESVRGEKEQGEKSGFYRSCDGYNNLSKKIGTDEDADDGNDAEGEAARAPVGAVKERPASFPDSDDDRLRC